jgi:hypothetical protein
MPEHFAQSQEFMIVDVIIPLRFVHCFGEECYWVKDLLFISLCHGSAWTPLSAGKLRED